MKTPKIIFRYSDIYDQNWKKWIELYKTKDSEYPSSEKIKSFIKKVGSFWIKYENKIFKEISDITELKWEEKFIPCYIVGKCMPFSDPLTIRPHNFNLKDFSDALIHELIHQLFDQPQNTKSLMKSWNYIDKKYNTESRDTRNHIPIFAIMQHIYIKFFDMNRLERHVKVINSPDYARAWQIVRQEGYQNIIREFRKRIK